MQVLHKPEAQAKDIQLDKFLRWRFRLVDSAPMQVLHKPEAQAKDIQLKESPSLALRACEYFVIPNSVPCSSRSSFGYR